MSESIPNTVLVTGGCGLLGSHVVDALVAHGKFHVVAVSRNPTRHCNPDAQYLACDVTTRSDVSALLNKVRPVAIIHTVTPGPFAPAFMHTKDQTATKDLVELASQSASVRAFVYTGSAEAIENVSGARGEPLSETEAILHTSSTAGSAYALAKATSDALVLEADAPAFATATLRLPAMYGPRENKKGGIASSFKATANSPATRIQMGDNKVVLDWVYVENAARAHVLAVEALLQPQLRAGVHGEAFFITDGAPVKLWDFVRSVWTAAGDKQCHNVKKIIVPWWVLLAVAAATEFIFGILTLGRKTPPLTRLHVHYMKEGAWFSIAKARERLGYEPLISTSEGIRRTVTWLQQNA